MEQQVLQVLIEDFIKSVPIVKRMVGIVQLFRGFQKVEYPNGGWFLEQKDREIFLQEFADLLRTGGMVNIMTVDVTVRDTIKAADKIMWWVLPAAGDKSKWYFPFQNLLGFIDEIVALLLPQEQWAKHLAIVYPVTRDVLRKAIIKSIPFLEW